jgi:TldD protein
MVRALVKGGWGIATFNDLANLEDRVADAVECARLVGRETSRLASVEPAVDQTTVELKRDFRGISLSEKKKVAEEYNKAMLHYDDNIQSTNVLYKDRFRTVHYGNSEGAYIEDERPYTGVMMQAIARSGTNVQQAKESSAGIGGFELVQGLQEKALTVAKRAVELLSAPPVKGGKYTVVLNPTLAGVFAHEAFGHLSEADFVYENERMKELMVLGKTFGAEILDIIDDGSIPGLSGTHKYDDEGVKTGKSYLIREGVLVGRLHSRETAAIMGEEPTGNARAMNYEHEPIVRMTNTYIDKGDATFEDMIKDIELGVYAVDSSGGQTEFEMFTFSADYAYMIRNGKIAELVRDVVLTGNVFETLKNINMIGDEVEWPKMSGGCGKGGQSPLPVGIGSPYIRVSDVIVGGR